MNLVKKPHQFFWCGFFALDGKTERRRDGETERRRDKLVDDLRESK